MSTEENGVTELELENGIVIEGWMTKHAGIGYEFFNAEPKLWSSPPYFRAPEASVYVPIPKDQMWELPEALKMLQSPARMRVRIRVVVECIDEDTNEDASDNS